MYMLECLDVIKLAGCPYADKVVDYTLGFCKCSQAVAHCG